MPPGAKRRRKKEKRHVLLEKELPGLRSYSRADPLAHGHASNQSRARGGGGVSPPTIALETEGALVTILDIGHLQFSGSGWQRLLAGLTAVNVFFRSMYSSRIRPSESNSDSQNRWVTPLLAPLAPRSPSRGTDIGHSEPPTDPPAPYSQPLFQLCRGAAATGLKVVPLRGESEAIPEDEDRGGKEMNIDENYK